MTLQDLTQGHPNEAAEVLLTVNKIPTLANKPVEGPELSGKDPPISYDSVQENDTRRMSSVESYIDDLSIKSDYDPSDLLFPFMTFEQKATDIIQEVKERALGYIDKEIETIRNRFRVPQADKEMMVLPEYLLNPNKDDNVELKSIDRVLYCVPKQVQHCVQLLRKDIETISMTLDILVNNFDVIVEACSLMNPTLLQWRDSLNSIRKHVHEFEEKTFTDQIPWYKAKRVDFLDPKEMIKKKLDELDYKSPRLPFLNELEGPAPPSSGKKAVNKITPKSKNVTPENPKVRSSPSTSKKSDISEGVKRPFRVPDKPVKRLRLSEKEATPRRKSKVPTPEPKSSPDSDQEDDFHRDDSDNDLDDGSDYDSADDGDEDDGEEDDEEHSGDDEGSDQEDQEAVDLDDDPLSDNESAHSGRSRSSSKNASTSKTSAADSKSKSSKKKRDEPNYIEIKICKDHPCPYVQPANAGSNFSRHNSAYHDKEGVPGNFIKTRVTDYEYAARLANWQSYLQVINKERRKMIPKKWAKYKKEFIPKMAAKYAYDPRHHQEMDDIHHKAIKNGHCAYYNSDMRSYGSQIIFKHTLKYPKSSVRASEVLKAKIEETLNPIIIQKLNEVANMVEYNFVKPRSDLATQTEIIDLFCDAKRKKHKTIVDFTNFELFAIATPSSLQGFVQELRNDVEFLNRSGLEVIEKFREILPGLSKVVPSLQDQRRLLIAAEKQLKFLERSFYTRKIGWLSCANLTKDIDTTINVEDIQQCQSASSSKNKGPPSEVSSKKDGKKQLDKVPERTDDADDQDTDNYVIQVCAVQYCNFVVEVTKGYDFNSHYDMYHPTEDRTVMYVADNVKYHEFSKLKKLWREQRNQKKVNA
uniref:Uncharacterized protein n=1 Tax=Tetranychus urticae TaxID=32264 RepID=T1L529_TETUR